MLEGYKEAESTLGRTFMEFVQDRDSRGPNPGLLSRLGDDGFQPNPQRLVLDPPHLLEVSGHLVASK